jgi:hypothetical protein
MDIRFGTWEVRSVYRIGSCKTVATELGKCKLDLVVNRRSDGRRAALNGQRDIHFSTVKGMRIASWGQAFRTQENLISG